MEQCPSHEKMIFAVEEIKVNSAVILTKMDAIDKRINGSIDDIHDHIRRGSAWRATIASIGAALIIQIIVLANMWGALIKSVEINTVRLTHLEDIHPRTTNGDYKTVNSQGK